MQWDWQGSATGQLLLRANPNLCLEADQGFDSIRIENCARENQRQSFVYDAENRTFVSGGGRCITLNTTTLATTDTTEFPDPTQLSPVTMGECQPNGLNEFTWSPSLGYIHSI